MSEFGFLLTGAEGSKCPRLHVDSDFKVINFVLQLSSQLSETTYLSRPLWHNLYTVLNPVLYQMEVCVRECMHVCVHA